MVIIFTHNNKNINGFDFEKMTGFLTKHINTCTVLYMSISLTTLYKNHNVDGINCLYKCHCCKFFKQPFNNFWNLNLCTQL